MKKQHLADLVAERMNVTTARAVRFIDALDAVLRQEQTSAVGVSVEGLGTFRCGERTARMRTSAVTGEFDVAALPNASGRTAGPLRRVDAERRPDTDAPAMSQVEAASPRPSHAVSTSPLARVLDPDESGEFRAAGMRDMVDVLRASARLERATPKRRA